MTRWLELHRGDDVIARVELGPTVPPPGRISEIFAPYLRDNSAGDVYWVVSIENGPDDDRRRATPAVEGSVEVETGSARARRSRIHRVEGPGLETFVPARHGIDPADLRKTNVVLTAGVHRELAQTLHLSDKMETGGFLAGTAYVVDGYPDAHLVRVTRVIEAENTGAGPTQFTFTPDSFVQLSGMLNAGSGETLLGWYHSHLFSARGPLALSMTDVGLHFRTFQRPFQVAGLINYVPPGERVVRFFARYDDEMRECPQWVEDENAQCRLERPGRGPR